MVGLIETDEERKQRKREKKERKRLAAEEATNETEAQSTVEIAPESVETEEERKARKAAKKERKRAQREQESNEATNENGANNKNENGETEIKKRKITSVIETPAVGIKRNFYTPHPATIALTQEEVDNFRTEHKIAINEADESIKPVTKFEHSTFPSELLAVTKTFKTPTAIQSQCWPVLLSGRDCISIAETGSGKTLGFVLPGIIHILAQKPIVSLREAKKNQTFNNGAAGPIMLILAPTRELAIQTKQVCDEASQTVNLRTVCIYGGVDKNDQRAVLDHGVHTIVATPGRLLALIESGLISLNRVSYLVLDEADRMLDMGFEPDIRAIINHCHTPSPTYLHRQTLMFSATWPTNIQSLAATFIHNPVHVNIGGQQDELKANHRVSQTIIVLENDKEKFGELKKLISKLLINKTNKLLVFVLYKKEIDIIERFLNQQCGLNNKCVVLSSDRNQSQRLQAIEAFKNGQSPVLVATDVAARGLDINQVSNVINFTFPLTVEDYVHRIGRTGRGGQTGASFTFFTKAEKHLSGELINVLKEANENVPESLLKFGTAVRKKEHGMYGAHFKANSSDQPMKAAVKVKFDD